MGIDKKKQQQCTMGNGLMGLIGLQHLSMAAGTKIKRRRSSFLHSFLEILWSARKLQKMAILTTGKAVARSRARMRVALAVRLNGAAAVMGSPGLAELSFRGWIPRPRGLFDCYSFLEKLRLLFENLLLEPLPRFRVSQHA